MLWINPESLQIAYGDDGDARRAVEIGRKVYSPVTPGLLRWLQDRIGDAKRLRVEKEKIDASKIFLEKVLAESKLPIGSVAVAPAGLKDLQFERDVEFLMRQPFGAAKQGE